MCLDYSWGQKGKKGKNEKERGNFLPSRKEFKKGKRKTANRKICLDYLTPRKRKKRENGEKGKRENGKMGKWENGKMGKFASMI